MFLNIIVVASKSVYWSVSIKSLNKMVLLLNDLSKLEEFVKYVSHIQ
jgi:hypothetical protein